MLNPPPMSAGKNVSMAVGIGVSVPLKLIVSGTAATVNEEPIFIGSEKVTENIALAVLNDVLGALLEYAPVTTTFTALARAPVDNPARATTSRAGTRANFFMKISVCMTVARLRKHAKCQRRKADLML